MNELAIKNFDTLELNELESIDGGGALTVAAGIATVAGMGWACYQLGTGIGKAIGYITK